LSRGRLILWSSGTLASPTLSLDLGGVSRAMLIRKDKPGVGGKALLMPERLLVPLCFNIIAINAKLAETAETYLEFSNFITLR